MSDDGSSPVNKRQVPNVIPPIISTDKEHLDDNIRIQDNINNYELNDEENFARN